MLNCAGLSSEKYFSDVNIHHFFDLQIGVMDKK